MAKYLNLDWKTSQMYEWSKTQQENSVEADNGNGYRSYYDKGVTGELQNVSVRDGKFGQQLSISLKDSSGDYVNLQFGLYDQKNNVDNQYVESIIRFLGSLKKGETYRFYPYRIDAETQRKQDEKDPGREVRDKYYDTTGMSVKTEDGERVEPFLNYKGKNAIPKVEWKENAMGKNRPTAVSLEAKNEFLLTELKKATEGHLAYQGSDNSSNEQPTQKQEKVQQKASNEVLEDDNDDSLPF